MEVFRYFVLDGVFRDVMQKIFCMIRARSFESVEPVSVRLSFFLLKEIALPVFGELCGHTQKSQCGMGVAGALATDEP